VYDEIAPLHSRTETGEFTASDLNTAVLLDSVITEAMRINAPVPLSSPRTVPPEGIEIAGTRLPGGIHVFTPTHVYNVSEKYYVRPRDFIPERWTTRPELVLDKRVFHPFGFGMMFTMAFFDQIDANFLFTVGHYDCVGQKLVKNFLQLVIAYTLWNYDFAFAPCEDGTKFHGDERFQITLKTGSLNCVFTNRRAGLSVSPLVLDTHLHTKDTSACA
jgi:tryprostatin B 6-hydroxylase